MQSRSAEAELQIFGSAKVDLSIFGSPGRTSAEDARDLSKSCPSGTTESGTSDLWQ